MKFKVGDKVKRINGYHQGMKPGDIGTIIEWGSTNIHLREWTGGHAIKNFELYLSFNNFEL